MTDLEKLKDLLEEVSTRDGVVTPEEQKLLDSIYNFMRQYRNYQEKAEEDGRIDENELARLVAMRKGILEGAWVEALDDGIISSDESGIISTIYEFLKDFKVPRK